MHVILYEEMIALIPEGLVLHHECEHAGCVNPWHLTPMTAGKHALHHNRLLIWQSEKAHCPRGHALTEENLVAWDLKIGRRRCLACHREKVKDYMRHRRGQP